MIFSPHVAALVADLRRRPDIPESLFEIFEALKSLDPELPLEERGHQWEAAMEELRRYWRRA